MVKPLLDYGPTCRKARVSNHWSLMGVFFFSSSQTEIIRVKYD